MLRRVRVRSHERGFALRRGELVRYLAPGTHWLLGFGWAVRREPVSGVFFAARDEREVAELARLPEARADFAFVSLRSHERALVFRGGRLEWVLASGAWAFWTVERAVRVEVVDVSSVLVDPLVPLEAARLANGGSQAFEDFTVPARSVGFLSVDGVRTHRLGPGRHVAWRGTGALRLELVPSTPVSLEVAVADVWTHDRVSLRVGLEVSYRVSDPDRWVESREASLDALRKAASTAVRTVAARRTRSRFPGDRTETGLALEAATAALVRDLPVEVVAVSVGKVQAWLERPRFRGFGARGREVAAALRDYATRPWAPERRFRRH